MGTKDRLIGKVEVEVLAMLGLELRFPLFEIPITEEFSVRGEAIGLFVGKLGL